MLVKLGHYIVHRVGSSSLQLDESGRHIQTMGYQLVLRWKFGIAEALVLDCAVNGE